MIGLFLLLAPPNVTAIAVADRTAMRLSDHAMLSVSFEGSTPLAVAIPAEWLAEESTATWRARVMGTAIITPLANDRERWEIKLRLDPYATGDPLPLALKTVEIRSGREAALQTITLPTVSLRVTTDITAVHADETRTITGIETVPEVERSHRAYWWAVGVFAVISLALVLIVRKRNRTNDRPESTDDWLNRELANLEQESDTQKMTTGIATILRNFVSRRFGLSLDCRTANEAGRAFQRSPAVPPTIDRDEFKSILKECERMQFDPSANGNALALLERSKNWIALANR